MLPALIVIPTYNERGNILTLLPEIFRLVPTAEILIVDDNSPDGTAKAVQDMARTYKQIHLLQRQRKDGLGRAYVAGFRWALERGYAVIAQMDADHSHRPQDLLAILTALANAKDFAVGSRWMREGRIANWNIWRWLLSFIGNFYARTILRYHVRDWTGGLNVWRADVLKRMDLSTLEAQGYAFQIELKYRALRLNFSGIEVPIFFEERKLGQSKMSWSIIVEAFIQVWRLSSKF